MEKIGLAVCYDTKNFGSQLQVLATIKKIEELGCDTEIIRYKKKVTPQFILQTIPRLIDPSFVKAKIASKNRNKVIKQHQDIYKNVVIRNKRFDSFVKAYFTKLSVPYAGWETLVKESSRNYDAFLTRAFRLRCWRPLVMACQ